MKPLKIWIHLLCQLDIAVQVSSLIILEHISKFHCSGKAKSSKLIQGDFRILQE